ncbi:MAG: ferrochelatase [Alphaproteobacteria bacterium]|nr:ferrochelatase [Alphaproteobacteria bacterium]
MKKTAVVLFNLGGPSSQEEVKTFLFNLFYDPAILTFPNPFRYLLAKIIAKKRLKKAKEIYSFLGGGSPLLKNTQIQALALERELGLNYKVFIAMRYAPPLIEEVWRKVEAFSPEEIILVPLYPQFSTTTTGSSLKAWKKVSKSKLFHTRIIPFYPMEKGFLGALKERTMFHYQKAKKVGHPKVLLTAHGLPEKFIQKGDPYQKQVEETASSLINALGIPDLDYTLCYQSRVGPLKWTEPSLEEQVLKASQEKRPLVIVPISFVSEHSETLVELDIVYRNKACEEGCPSYHRVETVQTHPLFIKGLANLIICAEENSYAL